MLIVTIGVTALAMLCAALLTTNLSLLQLLAEFAVKEEDYFKEGEEDDAL